MHEHKWIVYLNKNNLKSPQITMRKFKQLWNSQQLQGPHIKIKYAAVISTICSKCQRRTSSLWVQFHYQDKKNLGINSKDERSTCCNIKHYWIRRAKNKGALLILIFSNLVTSTLHVIATTGVHYSAYQFWLIQFSITIAIAGWLTDAFIGRYKVIHYSVWIMWILIIAATVSVIVEQLNEMYHHYDETVRPALFCLVSIGLGGFQANIYSVYHVLSSNWFSSDSLWIITHDLLSLIGFINNFVCMWGEGGWKQFHSHWNISS